MVDFVLWVLLASFVVWIGWSITRGRTCVCGHPHYDHVDSTFYADDPPSEVCLGGERCDCACNKYRNA